MRDNDVMDKGAWSRRITFAIFPSTNFTSTGRLYHPMSWTYTLVVPLATIRFLKLALLLQLPVPWSFSSTLLRLLRILHFVLDGLKGPTWPYHLSGTITRVWVLPCTCDAYPDRGGVTWRIWVYPGASTFDETNVCFDLVCMVHPHLVCTVHPHST